MRGCVDVPQVSPSATIPVLKVQSAKCKVQRRDWRSATLVRETKDCQTERREMRARPGSPPTAYGLRLTALRGVPVGHDSCCNRSLRSLVLRAAKPPMLDARQRGYIQQRFRIKSGMMGWGLMR